MPNNFGLSSSTIEKIHTVFNKYPEIEKVIVFGSRAIGNYKPGSDIDLALFGNLSTDTCIKIKTELNEYTSIPYFVDVVLFSEIDTEPLKDHIQTIGKIFFKRKSL